jgi:hypothetical protein
MTTLKLTLLALAGTLAAHASAVPALTSSDRPTALGDATFVKAAIAGGKPAITIKAHGGFVAVFK